MTRKRKPTHLINPYDPVEDEPAYDPEGAPVADSDERDDGDRRTEADLLRHLGRCPGW